MYDELIKSLRNMSKMGTKYGIAVVRMREAADAIEELQQQVEHYHGCMNDWFQEACDYKTMVEQMKATVIVEAQHTEMYDERDKKTLLEMAKSLPLTLIPCNTLNNDAMRWIPVTERLPETGVDVLVKFPQNMAVASIDIGEWVVNSGDGWCTDINLAGGEKNPTHWMPLPQPPKEVE